MEALTYAAANINPTHFPSSRQRTTCCAFRMVQPDRASSSLADFGLHFGCLRFRGLGICTILRRAAPPAARRIVPERVLGEAFDGDHPSSRM